MKKLLLLLLCVPLIGLGQACNYASTNDASELCKFYEGNEFASNRNADIALNKILSVTGMSKRFILKQCTGINNCVATSYKGKRYILYDNNFMDAIDGNSNNWSNLSILAHEIGHHVNGHSLDLIVYASETVSPPTLSESRQMELEADEYSGFVMYKLGATLYQAQKAVRLMCTNDNDTYSTHPKLSKRLAAIERGYNQASGKEINWLSNSSDIKKTGCVSGDCFDGYGKYINSRGQIYLGEWKWRKSHGKGTCTFANGTRYTGEYKNGKKNGQGTFTWPEGDKYVGEFKDGLMNGQGTYLKSDGDKYVGEWRDGRSNGQGTYTYGIDKGYTIKKGDKYVGEWKDGKKHGQGTYMTAFGSKYVGEWKDNRKHGQGTSTSPGPTCCPTTTRGYKYVGEWKNGVKDGFGTYTEPYWEKYIGEWKDGKKHGQGTYTRDARPVSENRPGAIVKKGLWKDGKFIGEE